jgi:hypothetical protein
MADLVVIVPSRGRPQAARELADAFTATCTADTELLFAVDYGDPTVGEYPRFNTWISDSRSMVEALNNAALARVDAPTLFAVGFLGDDHRPRTRGWDAAYLEALRELGTGIVYGDDLLQRRNLPTQVAMTADIVRTLGFMAPPALTHLYVDNYWLELGTGAACIRYLPDVVVEHRHPVAGKAQWDEGYARVNNSEMYARDEQAFREYYANRLASDVEKVRALVGVGS